MFLNMFFKGTTIWVVYTYEILFLCLPYAATATSGDFATKGRRCHAAHGAWVWSRNCYSSSQIVWQQHRGSSKSTARAVTLTALRDNKITISERKLCPNPHQKQMIYQATPYEDLLPNPESPCATLSISRSGFRTFSRLPSQMYPLRTISSRMKCVFSRLNIMSSSHTLWKYCNGDNVGNSGEG